MKPIEFKEQTKVYAKDQKPYLPLPVYENSYGGHCISCWKLTFKEKLNLLFTGKLWIKVLNFGKPLQPIRLMVDVPFDR